MIPDNVKAIHNASTFNLEQLKITAKIQNGKLIINALSSDDGFEYLGEFVNQVMDLEDIKELIDEEKIKIVTKTQNLLKIKVGGMPIQLIRIIKENLKNQIETIKTLLNNQQLLESQIKQQNDELMMQKVLMKEFEAKINDLMLCVKEFSSLQELKQRVEILSLSTDQKIDQLEINFDKKCKEMKLLFEKQQSFERQSFINVQKQIADLKKQINDLKINLQKKSQKNVVQSIISQEKQSLQKQILNNKNQIKQIKISLSQQFKFLNKKSNFNNIQKIQVQKKESPLKIAESKPSIPVKISPNKQITSTKWSSQLKSQLILIIRNVVTLTQNTIQGKFCLLNASLSNKLKQKQSWTFKIKHKTKLSIFLGICLKSKMQKEYKFTSQNIRFYETGHGLYLIGSNGNSFSHSNKDYNWVDKCFKFDVGDEIRCEYDPIDMKLRFWKNNADKFELQIVNTPQDDEYYGCVSLKDENCSVQLICSQH